MWLLGLHIGVLLSIYSHYTILLICIHLNFSMMKVLSLKKQAVRDVQCGIICIKLENINKNRLFIDLYFCGEMLKKNKTHGNHNS